MGRGTRADPTLALTLPVRPDLEPVSPAERMRWHARATEALARIYGRSFDLDAGGARYVLVLEERVPLVVKEHWVVPSMTRASGAFWDDLGAALATVPAYAYTPVSVRSVVDLAHDRVLRVETRIVTELDDPRPREEVLWLRRARRLARQPFRSARPPVVGEGPFSGVAHAGHSSRMERVGHWSELRSRLAKMPLGPTELVGVYDLREGSDPCPLALQWRITAHGADGTCVAALAVTDQRR